MQAPQVRFETRINLGCVGQNGVVSSIHALLDLDCIGCQSRVLTLHAKLLQVDARHFHVLSNWSSKYKIENILVELRREMGSHNNRKLQQPPEGTVY